MTREEMEARAARLERVLEDACAYMVGNISGVEQLRGIVREAMAEGVYVEIEEDELSSLKERIDAEG